MTWQTPNFGLSVEDIPFHPARQTDVGSPDNRLTLHNFVPSDFGLMLTHFFPNNSDARQPQDPSIWPPPIILDIAYACAILHVCGSNDFIPEVRRRAHEAYYNDTHQNEIASSSNTEGYWPV